MIKTPLQILSNYDFRLKDFRTDKDTQILYEQNDVIEAIEAYHNQFESKWISVEKETPICYKTGNWDGKISDYVLIHTKEGNQFIASLNSGYIDGSDFNDWYDQDDFLIKESVTHWQSLPHNPIT